MKKLIVLFLSLIITCSLSAQQSFLSQQRNYSRVRQAIAEKEEIITEKLRQHGLTANNVHILITAFKTEKQLEVYAKKNTETTYQLIATYNICASSGELGPKCRQGDGQVPEGFYHIDRFNPSSSFHLSLGVNYPNQADRKRSNAKDLGGDIFIHGSCVTIGCLPMTNDKIKEIYLYAVYAKNNEQQNIPVYIFPFRMTNINFEIYTKLHENNQEIINFWKNLKTGYDKFFSEMKALNVGVDNNNGEYSF